MFQFNVCGTFYWYVHYFLSYGKGTRNSCKLDATVNFFSTVAGNITVKAKRKSNLENYNLILCFETRAFSLTLRFKVSTAARMSKKQQVLLSKTTTLHVPRTFFIHFFSVFAFFFTSQSCKYLFSFYGGRKQATTKFYFSF